MIITLWLSLCDGTKAGWPSDHELWIRNVETGALPVTHPHADDIVLWPGEDGQPTEGPLWPVRRRFMIADGSWHVELCRMVLDPTDDVLDTIGQWGIRDIMAGLPIGYRSWHTPTDDDPRIGLARGGWKQYGESA